MTSNAAVKRRAVDAAVWRATFREVKIQVANLRKDEFATSNVVNLETGEWVDLKKCDDEEGEGSTGWPPRQWYFAFEILMFEAPDEISSLLSNRDDDLLFFVYSSNRLQNVGKSPIFARRKSKTVPVDLVWGSELANLLDWRASLLLNIVLLTKFRLTVARCSPFELPNILNGTPSVEGTLRNRSKYVLRNVHPSPVKLPMTPDNSRSRFHNEPEVSYPNICFTVDDFDEAFQDMTLEDPSECYAVALYAQSMDTWGRALISEVVDEVNSLKQADTLAFNGYADCRQVETAVRERAGRVSALKAAKIVFKGPGGIGQAEAMVTVLGGQQPTPFSEVQKYIRRISIALFSALDVQESSDTDRNSSASILRCALTSLCLPINNLVWDVLRPL